MHAVNVLIRAIYSGLITGFIVSIPLGPAGLESVKRTISGRFNQGILVAIGAVMADTFDLILINFGILNLLSVNRRTEALFWILSGIVLAIIGYRSVKKHHNHESDLNPKVLKESKFKSMPFLTGFLLTFSNPLTHSLWLTLSGTVIRVWYYSGKAPYYAFIISIIVGMICWFVLLNLLVLRGKKVVEPSSSQKISLILTWAIVVIGALFVIYGLIRLIIM